MLACGLRGLFRTFSFSELFPKPQSLQIVLIFRLHPQVLKRSCCKHTHLFKIDPWVTPSFPQGDPIIFFDHPRVISATRAWHTPVATHQPQAEGSPPERLGGQQPGRSRPDRDANKIRRYIRIKCYSRELPMRRGSTLSGCKRPRHQCYLLQLSFSSI